MILKHLCILTNILTVDQWGIDYVIIVFFKEIPLPTVYISEKENKQNNLS